MNRIALWIVVTLLLIGGAWMLGQKGAKGAPESVSSSAAPAAEKPPARPSGDFVLATVNGEPVYHTDFVLAVQSLPAATQPIAGTAAGKRMLLEELVKLKVLKQEALRQKLDRDPEVSVQMASAMDNMLAAVALDEMVTDAPADPRTFYDAYTNQFRGTGLRQILIAYDGGLVPPKSGGAAMTRSDALAKAAALVNRIRAGESFAAVAAAESDDVQSAAEGGDLGLVRPGQLGSALEKQIEALALNQVSDPIRSAFGIHIFEVMGREVSRFEDIEGALRQQGAQLRAQIMVNALKEKANVEVVNEDFFEAKVP